MNRGCLSILEPEAESECRSLANTSHAETPEMGVPTKPSVHFSYVICKLVTLPLTGSSGGGTVWGSSSFWNRSSTAQCSSASCCWWKREKEMSVAQFTKPYSESPASDSPATYIRLFNLNWFIGIFLHYDRYLLLGHVH